MKYRKKAIVEAIMHLGAPLLLNTKTGRQVAYEGDYIITNPDGERYPCNARTFLDTYEPVE